MTKFVEPAIGLYWYVDFDPTILPGVPAPLWQLLIRTDNNSLYYKAGLADTAWILISGAGGGPSVDVQDESVPLPGNPHATLNFVGAGVTATDAGAGVATITIPGAASGIAIDDEGAPIAGNPKTLLNFTGGGVTAIDTGGATAAIVVPGETIQDEGVPLAGAPHVTLNFVGAGVIATDAGGGVATITVANPVGVTVTFAMSPYSILPTDEILFVDTSGGAVTLLLPNPTTFGYPKTYRLIDTKGTFSTNFATVTPFAAEKIEGLAVSKAFQTAWGGWSIVTDRVDWYSY